MDAKQLRSAEWPGARRPCTDEPGPRDLQAPEPTVAWCLDYHQEMIGLIRDQLAKLDGALACISMPCALEPANEPKQVLSVPTAVQAMLEQGDALRGIADWLANLHDRLRIV